MLAKALFDIFRRYLSRVRGWFRCHNIDLRASSLSVSVWSYDSCFCWFAMELRYSDFVGVSRALSSDGQKRFPERHGAFHLLEIRIGRKLLARAFRGVHQIHSIRVISNFVCFNRSTLKSSQNFSHHTVPLECHSAQEHTCLPSRVITSIRQ